MKEHIKTHFDHMAPELDRWRDRNRYYYRDIERLHQFIAPTGSRVLEIGCGSGDLLRALAPSVGVGIDFSPPVIELARQKYPHLQFHCLDAETLEVGDLGPTGTTFDYILLSGVLGYLGNIQSVLQRLHPFCHEKNPPGADLP